MKPDTCPKCFHRFHDSLPFCPNLASDNDCSCKGSGAPVINEEPELMDAIITSGEMPEGDLGAIWDRISLQPRCDCCGRQVPTPFHHDAHDDSGDSWDYCQECNDKGCDLVTCSL